MPSGAPAPRSNPSLLRPQPQAFPPLFFGDTFYTRVGVRDYCYSVFTPRNPISDRGRRGIPALWVYRHLDPGVPVGTDLHVDSVRLSLLE